MCVRPWVAKCNVEQGKNRCYKISIRNAFWDRQRCHERTHEPVDSQTFIEYMDVKYAWHRFEHSRYHGLSTALEVLLYASSINIRDQDDSRAYLIIRATRPIGLVLVDFAHVCRIFDVNCAFAHKSVAQFQ